MSNNLPSIQVTQKRRPDNSRMLGQVLISMGKLNEDQVKLVLEEQAISLNSFGEAAVKLQFLTIEEIDEAVACQFDYSILSSSPEGLSQELVMAYDPYGDDAEAFRALRSQLILNGYEKGRRAISIVTPNTGSGVSFVSANLAVALAQSGLHVCLIDTNMRSPSIGGMFDISINTLGLSDILRGKCGYDEVIIHDCFPKLGILPAGRIPPNPQELLGRQEFVWTVSSLLREYDIILFDTPAMNKCSDSKLVSTRVGSALLVARKNHTLSHDIEVLKSELEESECTLLGAVLNEF